MNELTTRLISRQMEHTRCYLWHRQTISKPSHGGGR